MRLNGKVAIVTGGASGFGEGIVRRFAEEGARVVIADLNEAVAQALAKDVNGLAVRTDVSRGEDVKALAKAATDKFGTIDILVNNAGIG
ncbi:MAG TPA: SDR family NAD(P)-dependent oxidoreductase, partial [Rhizomicrobium sp.]